MTLTEIRAEAGKQELFIERIFQAPRPMVFRAFCEPELIVQWMGPGELSTEIDKLDNRTHGSWRFIHRDAKGNAYAFNGVIHEVCEPERIIRTFEFEGTPERGHVSLETLRFDELSQASCKVQVHVVYQSSSDRDSHMKSGMERGVRDAHRRLDTLLYGQFNGDKS